MIFTRADFVNVHSDCPKWGRPNSRVTSRQFDHSSASERSCQGRTAHTGSRAPRLAGLARRSRVVSATPRIKVTDLLVEVDEWTGFTRHFTHLRHGEAAEDRALLLTAILADGINLGLTRMAEASPGIPLATLSRVAAWHIREETYTQALAELVNYHHRIGFTGHWGDGTTSSSDGQRFRTGGHGDAYGQVNARYGNDPGVTFYTHVSDQYAPFYTKLINATVRDATYVLGVPQSLEPKRTLSPNLIFCFPSPL
jgi:hypothetical protein